MRCGLRTVIPRDRLRLTVVKVWVVEMFVLNANFHFVETVADVGGVQFIDSNCLRVVRLNGDDGHAATAVVRLQLLDAFLVHWRDRTVMAGEYDAQDRTGRVIGKPMDFSIHAGQGKI